MSWSWGGSGGLYTTRRALNTIQCAASQIISRLAGKGYAPRLSCVRDSEGSDSVGGSSLHRHLSGAGFLSLAVCLSVKRQTRLPFTSRLTNDV